MLIREAKYEDIPEVLDLALRFFDEIGEAYDATKVVNLISVYVANPSCCVLVAEEDQKLLGLFVGYIDSYVHSDGMFAQDRFVYVLPEYRTKPVSHGLFKEFLAWSKKHDCREVLLSALWSKDNDSLKKVLEWLGCELKGYILKKQLWQT